MENLMIEMSMPELFEVVTALINRAEVLMSNQAPKAMVNQTIHRAEKFNELLKESGYDYWEDEKFTDLKERAV